MFVRVEQGMYSPSTLKYVFDQFSLAATEGSAHAAYYAAMLEYFGALGDVSYPDVRDNIEKAVSGGVKEGLIFNALIYWDNEFGMKDTEKPWIIETAMDLSVPGAFAQYLAMSLSMDSMDIRDRGDVIDGLRQEAVKGACHLFAFWLCLLKPSTHATTKLVRNTFGRSSRLKIKRPCLSNIQN